MIEELFHEAKEQIRDEKQKAWKRLIAKSPDIAAMISETTKTFGKPDAVEIAFSDGQQYRSAKIRAAQDYPDFESKAEASRKFFTERDSKCSAAGIESTARNSK
jgi:hypothetical protein